MTRQLIRLLLHISRSGDNPAPRMEYCPPPRRRRFRRRRRGGLKSVVLLLLLTWFTLALFIQKLLGEDETLSFIH